MKALVCGAGGFIAGQVFKFSGFVSDQGSLNASRSADEHYVIVTYWRSFEEHEKSHADEIFTCTTAGGVMPASRIDGRIMGNDRPGPISMRLRDAFWAKRAEGWHATPVDYEGKD